MTHIRQFQARDLWHLSLTNLDPLVENYDIEFYHRYLSAWPHLCKVAEDRNGSIIGYILGKLEKDPDYLSFTPNYTPWHGHVTALTVAPQARRQGLAKELTLSLERACEEAGAWFIDLFVRESNVAVNMYRGMGYSVYRRVVGYYSNDPTGRKDGAEDAFDMRKPLRRDVTRKWIRENGEEFRVMPEELYSG